VKVVRAVTRPEPLPTPASISCNTDTPSEQPPTPPLSQRIAHDGDGELDPESASPTPLPSYRNTQEEGLDPDDPDLLPVSGATGTVNPLYISKQSLCKGCVAWKFNHLFATSVFDTKNHGPFRSSENLPHRRIWDRRPLEEVQGNIDCKLCQFIYQLVTTSPAWLSAATPRSELFLHYRQLPIGDWLPDPYHGEAITSLALEVQEILDPEQCDSPLPLPGYPNLQCFHKSNTYQEGDVISPQMLVGRRIGSQIDLEVVKYWIKSCNNHGSCLQPALGGRTSPRIILVDIKSKRLVWATTSAVYAALSYVWGPPSLQQARLTKSTQPGLFTAGALADNNKTIPRTIRDAIIVCDRLSIPHLWVDALCIQQDSPDIHSQLGIMNDIYAAAYITIVAASGANSWAGLPGIMPNSRHILQPSIVVEDELDPKLNVEFGLALPDFRSSVMSSPWANRGWTFQERIFSSRMIIFTESQAFFCCNQTSRLESIVTEVDQPPRQMRHDFACIMEWMKMRNAVKEDLAKLVVIDSDVARRYFEVVRNFRRLHLTYPDDVLRAFSGVIASFETQLSTTFHFGLPLRFFTWAILLDYAQCVRRRNFPSWSWTGWSNNYSSHDKALFRYQYRVFDSRPATVFYRVDPTFKSTHRHDKCTLQVVEDMTEGAPELRRDVDAALYCQHIPEHLDGPELEQLLVFDTLASKMEVSAVRPDWAMSSSEASESDPFGMTFARALVGPEPRANWKEYGPYLPRKLFSKDNADEPSTRLLEFVLISKGRKQVIGSQYYSLFLAAEETQEVCLMIIDTDEKGISSRMSFCVLEEKYWLESNPKMRRVYLI
jgi:Heterokaryon incompatibility protein (HET)